MIKNAKAGSKVGMIELIGILGCCMSLPALSTDTVMPALSDIGSAYHLLEANAQQFMISMFFVGLSIGQLVAGPLSDTIGRKMAISGGLIIFAIGSFISIIAPNYEIMLLGRFLQGIGGGAPRVATLAMVRDRYAGREMAQLMSIIMAVFVIVPALAPTIGQGIMMMGSWHLIFVYFIIMSVITFLWMNLRLSETLHKEDRKPFTIKAIWNGMKVVCSNKMTLCYMISAGFIFGTFLGYLNSAQQIYQDYYDTGEMFPLYFGLGAISLGASSFINSRIVKKFGMRYIVLRALIILAIISVIFTSYEAIADGVVPLPVFLAYIMMSCFGMGMLFGNFNSLAMEPMGHFAGIASSVIGFVSLVIAMACGSLIGQLYNHTLIPVSSGFLILSLASLVMMGIAEHHSRKAEA